MVCFSDCVGFCATKTLYIQLLYNWHPRYGASECIAEVSICFSLVFQCVCVIFTRLFLLFPVIERRARFHKTLLVVVVVVV